MYNSYTEHLRLKISTLNSSLYLISVNIHSEYFQQYLKFREFKILFLEDGRVRIKTLSLKSLYLYFIDLHVKCL